MTSVFIIILVGMFYKQNKEKLYDKKRVIKLLLQELTNCIDNIRKQEIIKLLTYNLTKLLDDQRINLFYIPQYDWKKYFKINRMKRKFRFQVLKELSTFIEQSIIFLNVTQYKDIFTQIGELLINDDYQGIHNLLNQNNSLSIEIDKIKQQTKLSPEKPRMERIIRTLTDAINFAENHYKFAYFILIIVIVIIWIVNPGLLSGLPSWFFNLLKPS